ncbi:MAG: Ni/Fe-hydrogenase, b-type cytochrome subunit [Desulfuromonas sp.]|mgnify:CR=1 FL=1|uniref:Ni/Fe-hydrogenase, b-type cytochrome subunit n=1 Tax=Desulfuromonas sp. TaxID=892 RepID=UPI000CAE5ED8|nr:Ni/Fe-hydrogenase, b-type cytochrome subunit [Desulfuromonas sp.]PLX83512.1 MAG: Ni/Fe-hydrogenase, b-type cytochrome subunit [Desulfuromonas sp.]
MEIRYVWELPVRLTHWVNALCVVVLSLTGFYIGHPFIGGAGSAAFVMGWVRFVHFTFAYLFLVSVLVRYYWFFAGNHDSSWRMYTSWFTREGRGRALKFFRYYTFTGRTIPYEVGHNPLAVLAYAAVFTLFVVQIVTGFALYGQFAPGGFWDGTLGWLLVSFDSQNLRLVHHLVMWLLTGFAINHVYSAWLMDVKEMNGTMSSIFGGYKYIEPEDLS